MTQVLEQPDVCHGRAAASEHSFLTSDGTRLFYRAWLPSETPRRAVVLFHRGHEHSGRWEQLVGELGMEGTAFFAWDALSARR